MTGFSPGRSAPQSSATDIGRHDRLFYSAMAIALGLTVFTGFAATYYLQLFASVPKVTISGGPFTALVHIHGALFTSWVLLFIVQTTLIASRRVAMHRRLGMAGAMLAVAMVVAGVSIAIVTAARGSAPPEMDPLAFLAIPITDMVLFATFVGTALALRRDKETHKRLMLLAYISISVPAIARLPGLIALLGLAGTFGLSLLFVLVAGIYDFVSRRRVHKVYLWGGALLVASVPTRLFISGTSAWQAFAEFLTR